MSYRLIDSNAIAIKYPEVNEMPCVFADLPDGMNGQFIDVQSEPSQVARDIATIIENEQDMRVMLSQPGSEERTLTEDDYVYCTNCDHVEMCRWYPMCGCEFKSKPSAQSERKTGKWIDHSDNGYVECPFCWSATNCDDNINELHYCFSCGAKMEVEDA